MDANSRPETPRPHRIEPRYPVSCEVSVVAGSAPPAPYGARDVSRGGLFLACDAPLELFSDVHVILDQTPVPARVVHIVSVDRAQEQVSEPGMGLQFEPALPEQRAAIHAFVELARRTDPRPRVPVRRPSGNDAGAEADPILGFVLEAVDGERGPEELSEQLGLPLRNLEELLAELAQLGVIELVARRATSQRAAKPGPRPRSGPMPTVARELSAELRAEIATLHRRLPQLDHYRVLDVKRDASREEIREAFFRLSKRFHPDVHHRRCPREELAKLERVFARLSEAYGVLSRPASRAEYNRYLDQRVTTATRRPPPRARARARVRAKPAANGSRAELAVAAPTSSQQAEQPASRQLWQASRARAAQRELVSQLRDQASYEEKHQRWAEAAETWRRVCQEAPEDADAHRHAAMALHHARAAVSEALAFAERGVALAPEDAHNRRVLGQLYLVSGLKRKARFELETAAALQVSTPTLPAPM